MFIIGFAYAGMLFTEFFYAFFIRMIDSSDTQFKSTLLFTLTYVTMLIALLAVPLLSRRKLFLSKFNNGIDYIYGLAFAITLMAAGVLINALTSIWHTPADNINQQGVESIAKSYPLIGIFIMGIVGPICEELTYRVGLYSFLRRINKYLALILTMVIFAMIHFTFDAENIVEELWSLPSYLVSGLLLTLAYELRGPACSMTAHACYNLIAIIMIMVAR
jgi:membrane protease YdiL (CAAX protease family)